MYLDKSSGFLYVLFRYRKIHGNRYSFSPNFPKTFRKLSPNFPQTCISVKSRQEKKAQYIFIVFLLFLRRRQRPKQTVSYIRYLSYLLLNFLSQRQEINPGYGLPPFRFSPFLFLLNHKHSRFLLGRSLALYSAP